MKPKTKRQKLVVKLSKNYLKPLSEYQKKYAAEHCLDHVVFRTKSGTSNCLDCGHSWKGERPKLYQEWHREILKEYTECPNCKGKKEIRNTNKRTLFDGSSFQIITVCKGFQVIRYFEVNGISKTNQKKEIMYIERSQIWINSKGEHEIICCIKNYFSNSYSYDLDLRQPNKVHDWKFSAYKTYPKIKVIPEILRNGFNFSFHSINPYSFFKSILSSNVSETLLKSGKIDFFKKTAIDEYFARDVINYWSSLKIVFKNNYEIKSISSYLDYLKELDFLNKDLHCQKYLMPKDFQKAHRATSKKKALKKKKQRLIDRLKREQAERQNYFLHIKKYEKIEFKKGSLIVRPLLSVDEVKEAGDKLRHCIYDNGYHNETHKLLLGAYYEGKLIETADVHLESLSINHCLGVLNNPTKKNKQIKNLINSNMDLIRKLRNKKDKRYEPINS